PHPDVAPTLASHPGPGDGRTQGLAGGAGPGAELPQGDGARPGDGTPSPRDGDERLGFARPSLPEGPAATVADDHDEPMPSDDTTTRLLSDDPHPHALAGLELRRAASPGPSEESRGPADRPGFSALPSRGKAALPQGDPDAPAGPELWLRTSDRRYVGYFQAVYAKVKEQWRFPRKLALKLEQGV